MPDAFFSERPPFGLLGFTKVSKGDVCIRNRKRYDLLSVFSCEFAWDMISNKCPCLSGSIGILLKEVLKYDRRVSGLMLSRCHMSHMSRDMRAKRGRLYDTPKKTDATHHPLEQHRLLVSPLNTRATCMFLSSR